MAAVHGADGELHDRELGDSSPRELAGERALAQHEHAVREPDDLGQVGRGEHDRVAAARSARSISA